MDGNKKSSGFGLILGFLFAVCDKLASVFASGTVYRVFTSQSAADDAYRSSLTVGLCKKLHSKTRRFTGKIKTLIAHQFETSMLLRMISGLLKKILNMPGRVFGSFMLTWSAYAVFIELIKRYVLMNTDDMTSMVCGAVVFISSVPLMFTDKSICSLAAESPVVSSILIRIVGVPEEILKPSGSVYAAQSVAVISGIVFGVMTYLISPLYMVAGFFALILISLIMTYPESGVVVSIALAPLLGVISAPSVILALLLLLTTVAYIIKVIRGKRVFKFGITELAVYGFMVAVLIGGITPGSGSAMQNALLSFSLMLIYPLAVNLMKYKHWIKTCMAAVAVPAAFTAFVGIVQYALGLSPGGWVDESLFGEITARTVSLFSNPNMLGVYLSAVFPTVLMFTLPRNNIRIRILGGMASVFIVICTVLTFSRSAWIALIVGAMIFAVSVTPKGILWAIPTAGITAVAMLVFPNTVGARISNLFTLADSANSYRVSVWNSSWKLFSDVFSGGIGLGEDAFKTAYANYAEAGTSTVMHSHSLYLQIGIGLGLIGLILFIGAVFASVRYSVSVAARTSSDKELTTASKAALSGAFALLTAGIFDYTWYNFRIMFIFWALLGIAYAASNIEIRNADRVIISESDEYNAFVSVSIPKTVSADVKKEKEGQDHE